MRDDQKQVKNVRGERVPDEDSSRGAGSAATLRDFEPRVMRVDCSQFASCQWHGKRLVSKLGVQPDPCPKCGKEVIA